jgi:hypothetical protein
MDIMGVFLEYGGSMPDSPTLTLYPRNLHGHDTYGSDQTSTHPRNIHRHDIYQ